MNMSIRGSLVASALCALLAACGGNGDTPTALPASVTISGDARADIGATAHFATTLATTDGLTFSWDFGDGSTGSGATATHTYAKGGDYRVTLAVANTAEDLRTSTTTIAVGTYSNVAGLNCTQANSAGWCWQHAIATGHAINDIAFTDATHAVAVGDDLTILKSADGGASWTPVALDSSLTTASLRSVRFYDALHGMALTDQAWALQTSDGGATWTANNLGGIGYGATFVDYSASRILLQTQYLYNAILSIDGGATWTAVGLSGQVQATATDCWIVNSTAVQRAAGCGAASTTSLTVPGYTYSSGFNGYQYIADSAFVSPTQAVVLGYSFSYDTYTWASQVWTTGDSGATWSSATATGLPTYWSYSSLALHMNDALHGVLYGTYDLTAYATQDGGHTWTPLVPATSVAQVYNSYLATGFIGNAMWQTSATQVAISLDLGQSWHTATVAAENASAQSAAITVLQYTDANNWVVSASHRFYVTHDGGQTFTRLLGPDPRDANAAYAAGAFLDAKNGKFITSKGAILSTADGGRTWTRADYPSTSGAPVALHFNSATDGWAILEGRLAHTTDGGTTWSTPLTNSAMTTLQGMSWGDATHAWTWGNGVLYATADGGATWTTPASSSGLSVYSAAMTGALTGVVNSNLGFQVTSDGGATWQATSSGTAYYGGPLVHTSGQTVWALYGTGFRSKDGGRTWVAAGPAGYTPTGIAFADDSNGWMVTSGGTVLRTVDGGDTWTSQPIGTDLIPEAIVAVDTQTAWIITRDGQILATATAGN